MTLFKQQRAKGVAGGYPQVAIDPSGNAVAVWSQSNGIWSNRYTPSGGWETAEAIGGTGIRPQVAIDLSGYALAVWAGVLNIWSSRYTPSGGWELKVTDASNSTMTDVTASSNARIIIKDNTLLLIVPKSEFTAADPKFRLTAFRHTGDYGIPSPHDWDGSIWPAVADGLESSP